MRSLQGFIELNTRIHSGSVVLKFLYILNIILPVAQCMRQGCERRQEDCELRRSCWSSRTRRVTDPTAGHRPGCDLHSTCARIGAVIGTVGGAGRAGSPHSAVTGRVRRPRAARLRVGIQLRVDTDRLARLLVAAIARTAGDFYEQHSRACSETDRAAWLGTLTIAGDPARRGSRAARASPCTSGRGAGARSAAAAGQPSGEPRRRTGGRPS